MKYNMNIVEKTLDNGLHVILLQKPEYKKSLFMCSAPIGGYDVEQFYKGNVIKHRTGCAHFLEHQMFRLHGEDVTDRFAQMQAQTNAFTSYTETAYYFQTTSDIYAPLDLLLDFVETLDIDYDSINKEKGIILSEYDMYQESPEQRLLKLNWNAMYHRHPMKIDILGTREDISDMTVEDLERFYMLNYDPKRLVLVGVTGKDLDPILTHIENHQRNVTSNIDVTPKRAIQDEPDSVVEKCVSDTMEINTPYVCIGYKLKPVEDSMLCEKVDLAMQVRLDSLMGPLNPDYQQWLDDRIITQTVGAECDFSSDHGYILFYAQTNKVDEFIGVVQNLVEKIRTESIDPDAFQSIRSRLIASNIRGTDQFESMAIDLIHAYNENYSYWDSLEIIRNLTIQEIDDIVQSMDYGHSTISTILPKNSNI